jgi:Zn-dependent hydrolases, including glyoxylases
MKTRLTLTIAIWALVTSLRGAETKSDDLHRPQKLADGVWAMTTKGGSNAGWFLFGDSVIAVDSGSDQSSADILSAIAETTGGKKISYLILTNNFGPHAGGAAAFAKRGAFVVSQEKFGPYFARNLKAGAGASSEGPKILTLSERVVLSDSKRFVEIDFVGPADSGGDLVVYLPNEQVLYSGDLVEAGILPPLFSKELEPEGWIATLEKLGKLNVKKLVPGYGPIGPVESIEATHSYLQQALMIAKRAIAEKVLFRSLKTRIQEPDLTIKGLPAELKEEHLKRIQALVQRLKTRAQEKPSGGAEKK